MRVFLLSTDFDVWNMVESRYYEPTKTVAEIIIIKSRDKWTVTDKKLHYLNVKAMNTLYFSLTA